MRSDCSCCQPGPTLVKSMSTIYEKVSASNILVFHYKLFLLKKKKKYLI